MVDYNNLFWAVFLTAVICMALAATFKSRQDKRHREHCKALVEDGRKCAHHWRDMYWGKKDELRERIAEIRVTEVFPLKRIRTSLVHQLKHSAEERHRLIGEVQRYRNMAGVAGEAYALMIKEVRLGLASMKIPMKCLRDIQEIIHNASAMLAAQEVVVDESAKQAAIKVDKKRVGSSRRARGRAGRASTAQKG